MLQLCPFKGPSLFWSQNMTGDIYCVISMLGACLHVFTLKQGISRLKHQMSTAIALFFSDKNLWFSSPWRKGGVGGGDVPALAVG